LFCVPSPIRPTLKKSTTIGCPPCDGDNVNKPPVVVKFTKIPIGAVFGTLNRSLFNCAGFTTYAVPAPVLPKESVVPFKLINAWALVEFASEIKFNAPLGIPPIPP